MPHEKYASCIAACNTCATACDHCAVSCLGEANVAEMTDCIRTDLDCAQACRLAAAVMSRGSDLAAEVCRLCADICDKCGEICEKHNSEHCRECARACRDCARECRKVAG